MRRVPSVILLVEALPIEWLVPDFIARSQRDRSGVYVDQAEFIEETALFEGGPRDGAAVRRPIGRRTMRARVQLSPDVARRVLADLGLATSPEASTIRKPRRATRSRGR